MLTKRLVNKNIMTDKSEQTKTKILAAALDEFAAHGLAGARVDEIARSAGVNKAMIYYHFDSKEDLFRELFQSEMNTLQTEVSTLLQHRNANSAAEMTQAVRELLDYVRSKKGLLAILMSETVQPSIESPLFFQLLDLSFNIGQETVRSSRPGFPAATEPIFDELFTGLLPLIYYVLMCERLSAYYHWDAATLDDRFIAYWLKQHGKF
jgi:AcrR family transcriptional regulator